MSLPWEVSFSGQKLLLMEPDFGPTKPRALLARGASSEVYSGARSIIRDPAFLKDRYTFNYLLADRYEAQFFEDFFDARRGKHESFWFPTWQWEFEPADYYQLVIPYTQLWFKDAAWYREKVFPLGPFYRYFLMLYGDYYAVMRAGSVDADAGFERISFTATLVTTDPHPFGYFQTQKTRNRGVRFHWLRWGRFDMDKLALEYEGESARATVNLIDCAREVTV